VAESAKRNAVAVYANFDMGASLGFEDEEIIRDDNAIDGRQVSCSTKANKP
jgi:hypothetical protein